MKIAAFLSSVSAWLVARIDGWVFVTGLVLFGAGLSWAWPPLGLIGAGLVLMAVSLFGHAAEKGSSE